MSKSILFTSVFWLFFACAHELLTGYAWIWVIPGVTPPLLFAVIPVVIIVISLFIDCRRFAVILIATTALFVSYQSTGLNIASIYYKKEVITDSSVIKVVQMNTDYWGQLRDGTLTDPRNKSEMLAFLKSLDADIYLLQEHMSRVGNNAPPITDLSDVEAVFPNYEVSTAGTLLTLSRFPVSSIAIIESDNPRALKLPPPPYVLKVDISVGDKTISTYNVHMPVQIIIEMDWFSKSFYEEIKLRHYIRKKEFDALVCDVVNNSNPLVIAGDFNTSQAMGDNRKLLKITEDAASFSNLLYPATWRVGGQLPKLWRNDWFLIDNNVHINSYQQLDPKGNSDHLVQAVQLAF